jgi:hypothetical protein
MTRSIPRWRERDVHDDVLYAFDGFDAIFNRLLEHRAHGAHRRRERHRNDDVLAGVAFDCDVVHQTEVHNPELKLWILDFG